jgi:hypothetical protein
MDYSKLSDQQFQEAVVEGCKYLDRIAGVVAPTVQRWSASYVLRLNRVVPNFHQGEVALREGGRFVLLDAEGIAIDAKFISEGDSIAIGDEVFFPCYRAMIGACVRRRAAVLQTRGAVRPRPLHVVCWPEGTMVSAMVISVLDRSVPRCSLPAASSPREPAAGSSTLHFPGAISMVICVVKSTSTS